MHICVMTLISLLSASFDVIHTTVPVYGVYVLQLMIRVLTIGISSPEVTCSHPSYSHWATPELNLFLLV